MRLPDHFSRSRASVDTAQTIPLFRKCRLSLMCELGKRPPFTKKTLIPKRTTAIATNPTVKSKIFHILTIFDFIEYRPRFGVKNELVHFVLLLPLIVLLHYLCFAKIGKENVISVEEWKYFADRIGKRVNFNINFFEYRKFSSDQIATKI